MGRPRQISNIQVPPRLKGFIPIGYYKDQSEPVVLHIDENEAIHLLDYEGLPQIEAAKIMNISRPTLTRIYQRARNKIAIAFTEARQILIEGGKVIFNGRWYECERCNCKFNNLHEQAMAYCPLCNSLNIHHIEEEI